jgi:hypothetical protein
MKTVKIAARKLKGFNYEQKNGIYIPYLPRQIFVENEKISNTF